MRPDHAIVAGIVGVAAAVALIHGVGLSPWSAAAAPTAAILVWLAAIDLETRLIPNRIVLPTTIALVAVAVAIDPGFGIGRAAAALAVTAALLVPVAVRPGGLGMGDVKLGALLGALLGAAVVEALLIGFGLAGLVGLVLVAARGRIALRTQLPLAPFLAVGGIVALLAA
ncbi:MAG TPA: prepilin peptidase [Gaiellaceae bacterium]|nr:prepilin peptidase [Gaiellaceae bacterium]